MKLWQEIEKVKSISVVGLQKNVGKTESLNFFIQTLQELRRLAVTSIGLDGEMIDQVTKTAKPEIKIYKGMFFLTTEYFFKEKTFLAEIIDLSERTTAIGRLVLARALEDGKVIIAGPASTTWLKKKIQKMQKKGAELVFVDGALSRLSPASPMVSEAMVLATGAAVSLRIDEIVKKTKEIVDLVKLEKVDENIGLMLQNIEQGVWTLTEKEGILYDWKILSVLQFDKTIAEIIEKGKLIYVAGAVTDRFLQKMAMQKGIEELTLVVRDFTKIFVSGEVLQKFWRSGGRIKVLEKSKLLAVTINPVSPNGYILDKEELKERLKAEIDLPIINVREEVV